ncbi:MAG: hypothetical protein ACOCX1_02745, partial [Fimbriimonadaceae bacterium]
CKGTQAVIVVGEIIPKTLGERPNETLWIEKVFNLDDAPVRSIMTPADSVIGLRRLSLPYQDSPFPSSAAYRVPARHRNRTTARVFID